MNNFDYPWGSDNADAPWNQGDEPMKECPECGGEKIVTCYDCHEGEDDDGSKCLPCSGTGQISCPECEGTGEIPMTDEDIQAEKDDYADMRMDEERLND